MLGECDAGRFVRGEMLVDTRRVARYVDLLEYYLTWPNGYIRVLFDVAKLGVWHAMRIY